MTKKQAYILLGILVLIYGYLTFGLPPDPRTLAIYKISEAKSRLVSLSVAAPLIAIWSLAFYGFSTFKEYARSIHKSPDGVALSKISNGLMVLAVSLPVSSILSSSMNLYSRTHPDFRQTALVVSGYFTIFVYLAAFIIMANGSRRLLKITKRNFDFADQLLAIFGFFVISGLYIYMTLRNTWSAPATAVNLVHVVPTQLVVATIILPYIFIWFSGFLAAARVSLFRLLVQGVIYRQSLRNLSLGIGLVVIGSIASQFFGSIGTTILKLSLSKILLIVYLLLAIIAAGYTMIAFGARKLKKFEEV